MFWSEAGAENLLSLRCQTIGPHWEAARQARGKILAAKARQSQAMVATGG